MAGVVSARAARAWERGVAECESRHCRSPPATLQLPPSPRFRLLQQLLSVATSLVTAATMMTVTIALPSLTATLTAMVLR